MPEITVCLGKRSYSIVVTTNRREPLIRGIKKALRGDRLFVFYDANLYALYGNVLRKELRRSCPDLVEFVIPSGEESKSAKVLSGVYAHLLSEKVRRDDLILACGGGVTSDLVGYAAATVLRGVPWAAMPTTLVGMVDAAIGGKTGINHRAGKNLIGAFWQPSFVFCDTSFLVTLPQRQIVAGLGEIAKYGGLCEGELLKKLIAGFTDFSFLDQKPLERMIFRSVQYKAGVVARDERENGYRMRLNLGHTFAHAIENAVGYGRLLHGEAVILGLLAAVELSCLVRPRSARALSPYKELIKDMVCLVPHVRISPARAHAAMTLDKKRRGNGPVFVLLEAAGKVFIADTIGVKLVRKAFDEMLSYYDVHGGSHAPHSGC